MFTKRGPAKLQHYLTLRHISVPRLIFSALTDRNVLKNTASVLRSIKVFSSWDHSTPLASPPLPPSAQGTHIVILFMDPEPIQQVNLMCCKKFVILTTKHPSNLYAVEKKRIN